MKRGVWSTFITEFPVSLVYVEDGVPVYGARSGYGFHDAYLFRNRLDDLVVYVFFGWNVGQNHRYENGGKEWSG